MKSELNGLQVTIEIRGLCRGVICRCIINLPQYGAQHPAHRSGAGAFTLSLSLAFARSQSAIHQRLPTY